jgi:hypothetical protein
VAYALQKIAGAAMVDIDTPVTTPDTLFEYLLADVEMQPCMQTSRVQFAILSTQLFIERCLRSLEMSSDAQRNVDPACFSASAWAWMKRFRIWQANREVWLWPENWLYPELRDDITPIFQKMMGKLLQSDIDDDSAVEAYLDYLADLEVIAKLEPCGMCCVPGASDDSPITHVVAHTAGATRTYYHRLFDGVGWYPWQEVPLKIDGDPVLPVVWKNRLFLFWLQVVQQQSPSTNGSTSGNGSTSSPAEPITAEMLISTLKVGQLTSAVSDSSTKKTTDILLNLFWSEYHNNKWQPPKSSDLDHPMPYLTGLANADDFDRATIRIAAYPDPGLDRLWLVVMGPGQVPGDDRTPAFVFYNTHSPPVVSLEDIKPPYVMAPTYGREVDLRNLPAPGLSVVHKHFVPSINLTPVTEDLFTWKLGGLSQQIVDPSDPMTTEQTRFPWTKPFLCADNCNAFYVTVALGTSDAGSPPYGIVSASPPLAAQTLPLITRPAISDQTIGGTSPELLDPYISRALPSTASVRFGDIDIGPAGSVDGTNP